MPHRLFALIYALVVISVGALAIIFAPRIQAFFCPLEQTLSRFALRRRLCIVILFFSVIAIRLVVLPLLPVPIPGIHDEFSYLLMADTFAHGRLANPPHPMWISFETFHENFLPTYSSMYPPAQGFVLAVGQWLGHPWIGVLLASAAMCAAILWMLQAWLPARWALLGGALVALKFGVASYWMNSYWGGAVPAIGGALILGALARIAKRAKITDALLLGLGVAILANSRPYEGFLFCIPTAAWFFWWLAGKTKSKVTAAKRVGTVLVPVLATLILTVAFMGYYNWRLTGDPLLWPYQLNIRTYHASPVFLWGHPRTGITYRNKQFEEFYAVWAYNNYQHRWSDVHRVTMEKISRYRHAYFWVAEWFALPALPFLFHDRRLRLLLVILALVTAGVFVLVWPNAHYLAPVTCVIFAVTVQVMRHLRTMWRKGSPVGLALSRAIVILLIFDTGMYVALGMCDPLRWPCKGDPSRAAIQQKLNHMPGKHLIMVRYTKEHNIHDEWVFNGADLDGSQVLWARELDPVQNAKLFAYYKDRQVWLVTPDTDNEVLVPYTPPGVPVESDE